MTRRVDDSGLFFALHGGLEIRNSVPGATLKEFIEKWHLNIAPSTKTNFTPGATQGYESHFAQCPLLISRPACMEIHVPDKCITFNMLHSVL